MKLRNYYSVVPLTTKLILTNVTMANMSPSKIPMCTGTTRYSSPGREMATARCNLTVLGFGARGLSGSLDQPTRILSQSMSFP